MNLQQMTAWYDFSGKTAVITGGTGVLGGEIACALVGCGANVVGTGCEVGVGLVVGGETGSGLPDVMSTTPPTRTVTATAAAAAAGQPRRGPGVRDVRASRGDWYSTSVAGAISSK